MGVSGALPTSLLSHVIPLWTQHDYPSVALVWKLFQILLAFYSAVGLPSTIRSSQSSQSASSVGLLSLPTVASMAFRWLVPLC